MKRILIFILVVFGLIAAGVSSLPLLVSSDNISKQLEIRLIELTGRQITYRGAPRLSLNPFLQVEIQDAVLPQAEADSDTPPLFRIERLRFNLKLLPLLVGKIRLANFTLVRPNIVQIIDENGQPNWMNASVTEASDLGAKDLDDREIGQFSIIDGVVETRYSHNQETVRIGSLNAIVDWPSLLSGWAISGNGIWRGESITFTNFADKPLQLLLAGESNFKISFDTPAVNFTFEGMANGVSGLQFVGDADVSVPSLSRLVDLVADGRNLRHPGIGSIAIDGKISANSREIKFSQASVKFDNNVAVGSLQFFWNGDNRTKASGTLAFSTLNINGFANHLSNKKKLENESETNAAFQNIMDLDIRFSAQNYTLGEHLFGSLAATVILNGNEWVVDVGEAEYFDGMLIATLSSRLGEATNEIEFKGRLANVDMEKFSRQLYDGEIYLAGKTNLNFGLKATEANALSNLRNFSGSIEMNVRDGQFDGLDFDKAIPALNANDGFVTIDDIKGTTSFESLQLDMLVFNGIGWITEGIAKSEDKEIQLSGKADLIGGGLAFNADMLDATSEKRKLVRIIVGGTLNNPLITRSPHLSGAP